MKREIDGFKRKVVLTGASGRVASLLIPALRERYELILIDKWVADREGNAIEGIRVVDLLDSNRDACRKFFAGTDAVVHCGHIFKSQGDAVDHIFEIEMKNIRMARNVYQTCLEAGVRRLVMASSNHAADYYESFLLDGKMSSLSPDEQSRSHRHYGWAKDVNEHLGFVYAVGLETGGSLENVQIRIGAPRETDVANCQEGDINRLRRSLAAYISQRDLAQLIIKSIETANIRNENGVPFQIFYGISNNRRAFWSLANAREVIGYEPRDNSELKFEKEIAEFLKGREEISL